MVVCVDPDPVSHLGCLPRPADPDSFIAPKINIARKLAGGGLSFVSVFLSCRCADGRQGDLAFTRVTDRDCLGWGLDVGWIAFLGWFDSLTPLCR